MITGKSISLMYCNKPKMTIKKKPNEKQVMKAEKIERVLKAIGSRKEVSRQELIRICGISKGYITNITQILIERGTVKVRQEKSKRTYNNMYSMSEV